MLDILRLISGPIEKIIDKVAPDAGMAEELKHQARMELLTNGHEIQQSAASIIQAEAKSEHWLTANWRPVLMLAITAILINNFILAPYFEWIIGESVVLPLPDGLWDLLTLGVGGYIVGRSGEKITKTWKDT
jgi:hypothetical protein